MNKIKLTDKYSHNILISQYRNISRLRRAGFTFIEILVVATIIGVLATIGAVSYRSANIKSRDGKRQADLEQIRAALEMYRADNSTYPATGSLSSLTPTYIQSIPNDPRCPSGVCATGFTDYSYASCASTPCTTYTLTTTLEVDSSTYTRTQP